MVLGATVAPGATRPFGQVDSGVGGAYAASWMDRSHSHDGLTFTPEEITDYVFDHLPPARAREVEQKAAVDEELAARISMLRTVFGAGLSDQTADWPKISSLKEGMGG